jgi:general secretion pathway protein D
VISSPTQTRGPLLAAVALLPLLLFLAPAEEVSAQQGPPISNGEKLIQLDFNDVELAVVIDTIARVTGKNFIYDDRVRGRVTIVSPTQVSVDQAYAVFESVLQVKGFTTVEGPGGVIKIIPIRDAKESSIETVKGRQPSPNRDLFVTRLIPLRYIDAEDITNTLKPLVSKDAALVAYPPTNTMILTDTAANIRRLLSILEAIDVETYKEELAVIKIEHADAATLGEQISEIYGAEVSDSTTPVARRSVRARRVAQQAAQGPQRGQARIITDDRTNSLIVLASRNQLEDIRGLVRKLDIPVHGEGSIRVYYLRHADAEELAQTLNGLISGAPAAQPTPGRGAAVQTPQALRAAVTELAGGVTLTADPATNSIVIQGSKEAYATLVQVIELLDIQRPQVLIEALIMEVQVTDSNALGMNFLYDLDKSFWKVAVQSATDPSTASALGMGGPIAGASAFATNVLWKSHDGDTTIQSILNAVASDGNTNIISAPHILTSDNEEAEIRVGDNIPIITSRVDAARGAQDNLSSSVNVERQDIGVTLRVTPQISEGETLRLKLFQEITGVSDALTGSQGVGNPEEVGVALTNRKIENTLVVKDGETVVIGGLIRDSVSDSVSKVPWLGDIPILGWLFKSVNTSNEKTNLLLFLTPHIIRTPEDLEEQTIRKREEFRERAGGSLALSKEERKEAEMAGVEPDVYSGRNPVRHFLIRHKERYPLERMREIEEGRREAEDAEEEAARKAEQAPGFGVRAGVFRDPDQASALLTEILDAGYEGALVSGETDGVVLYEIQVGPYPEIDEAEQVASVLRRSFELEPSVFVVEKQQEVEEP